MLNVYLLALVLSESDSSSLRCYARNLHGTQVTMHMQLSLKINICNNQCFQGSIGPVMIYKAVEVI